MHFGTVFTPELVFLSLIQVAGIPFFFLVKFVITKSHRARRVVPSPAPLLAPPVPELCPHLSIAAAGKGGGYQQEVAARSQRHAYRSV